MKSIPEHKADGTYRPGRHSKREKSAPDVDCSENKFDLSGFSLSKKELFWAEKIAEHFLPNTIAKSDSIFIAVAAKRAHKIFSNDSNTTEENKFVEWLSILGLSPSGRQKIVDAAKQEENESNPFENLDEDE